MKLRHSVAAVALAAAALCAAPAVASADDPEFPRNGVIPPGTYHVVRHPSNVIGSPLENCDLQVFVDGSSVVLVCPTFSRAGRQRPVGTDESYVTLDFVPIGLDLRDIDPRQGHWIGTMNIAGTPVAVPYPLAGVTLQRR
ncbi:hypothetical protein GV794_19105 [Nocardia cyriacigeorgica]|uniref:Uncharacterized protein n=1 Tax=Nocardia cyriacigeorgica TaxID=135487 RepID=A0A6P1DBL2_9NOCA|nr:hypothetical protein [Nocardia cyriacigeorgica]NEW40061.1 hypothetical protein [Nocardia cyriacigeorgica]NEW48145.1 hypothetical protein [Nocardia cyriacigeorgica]NEW51613.1 hypothetical protein [Nocardia cyriacigeorgica]NEW57750.1 hypothetical protein [Nocardia cyriacigeorgica]